MEAEKGKGGRGGGFKGSMAWPLLEEPFFTALSRKKESERETENKERCIIFILQRKFVFSVCKS